MERSLATELYRAAVMTFEDLSLMLPSPGVEDWQRDALPTAAVTIPFSGPFSGKLSLCIYGDLLPLITANMLGQMEPPTREMQMDALGEVANVVCGNMLPGIGGSDAIFHISPPVITQVQEVIAASAKATAQAQVGLEEGHVDLFLFVEGDQSIRGEKS